MAHQGEQKVIIYWSWKKTVVLVCALLIIPFFLIFSYTLSLKKTLLNREYYKENLRSVDTYNRLVTEGIPSIILEMQISDNALTDSLAKQVSIWIIQKTVDPIWVQDQTEKLVDKTADYLADPSKNITLDLSGSKDFLNKTSSALFLAENFVPSCEQAQTQASTSKLGLLANANLDCSKMKTNLDDIKSDLEGTRQKINTMKLGVINLDSYIGDANSYISSIRGYSHNIRFYFWFSLIALIILVAAIVLLGIGDIYFMLESVFLPLAIASLLALGVGLLGQKITPTSYIGPRMATLPDELKSIINDFMQTSILGIHKQLAVFSGILLCIFIVIYIVILILKRKNFKFSH